MTLTREEIQGMRPGKKLNELVMHHIFKMTKKPEGESFTWVHEVDGDIVDWQPAYFSPSTNISAAWEVVTHMKSNNWEFIIASEDDKIDVTFYWDVHRMEGAVFGGTAQEAICKAALLAVLNL